MQSKARLCHHGGVKSSEDNGFRVVHPLDDAAEQKCSSIGLGRIRMTPAVRISLGILRAYLIVMTLMLGYHVLDLAGVFHEIR
jgi:hypothetical protein